MNRTDTESSLRILWLRPTKPDNISVGRERIIEYLRDWGYMVNIQDASRFDAVRAILTGIRGEYDIIVGTVRMGLYVGSVLSAMTRTPLIADVTDPIKQVNNLPSPLYRLLVELEHIAIREADEALFVYKSSYTEAKRRGINGKKVENAVNYQNFNNPDQSVIETATTELKDAGVDDRPIAIYIGGLDPVYQIESILEAGQKLDTVQFVFIGDGELKQTVSKTAGKTENIFYLKTYEYKLMPGFLAAADIGLCLVDAEQPLKVLEYGAAGLPVIAAPGELEERFTDDELLYVDSVEELTRKITTLINNTELGRRYGDNLNKRAANTNWSSVATKYKQAINRVSHD